MEIKKIYAKIAAAKFEIKSSDLKKSGLNNFSKYNYFTPEQIEKLVFEACSTQNLLTMFNLKRNEFGEFGVLSIVDIDTGDGVDYEMATAIPDIKATNLTQQIGGCMTYTERYLKMSVFGITENSLDFDDKDNSKKQETKPQSEDNRNWLTEKQKVEAIDRIRKANFGDLTKEEFKKKLYSEFKMKKIYKEELDIEFNSPFNEVLNS